MANTTLIFTLPTACILVYKFSVLFSLWLPEESHFYNAVLALVFEKWCMKLALDLDFYFESCKLQLWTRKELLLPAGCPSKNFFNVELQTCSYSLNPACPLHSVASTEMEIILILILAIFQIRCNTKYSRYMYQSESVPSILRSMLYYFYHLGGLLFQ